jgi:plasmid stabilization system protein ParE
MAYKLVVLPQAEADITEAFTYLGERAPEIAARWYRHIRAEIESLAEMPARCPLAPQGAKMGLELRHLLYGKRPGIYRIVFRIVEDIQEVHVLAVRHGARKPLTDEDMKPFLELP